MNTNTSMTLLCLSRFDGVVIPYLDNTQNMTISPKVKSACKSSDLSGWTLSQVLQHGVTRSISTFHPPPGWDTRPLHDDPQHDNNHTIINSHYKSPNSTCILTATVSHRNAALVFNLFYPSEVCALKAPGCHGECRDAIDN